MGCCTNAKNNVEKNKQPCSLCNTLGNSIHYLAVEILVKEDLTSQVTKEEYFTCTNDSCDVVFFNECGDRLFLVQDINMGANFDEVTKSNESKCNSKCGSCNK